VFCKHGFFIDEGKILIKNLYQLKGYKATELMNEFPNEIKLLKSYETQSTDSHLAAEHKVQQC